MSTELHNPEEINKEKDTKVAKCLNCGAELHGQFCHECGQNVVFAPTIGSFVMEYINNIIPWDPLCIKTVWMLVSRPGRLTNEYVAGRHVSQVNPLKLNLFLLFIFVTIFMFFSGRDNAGNSVDDIITDEMVYPSLQLDSLKESSDFTESMSSSPRDTVLIYAPLIVASDHPDIIKSVQVIEDTHGEAVDKWMAEVPHALIEDKIIVLNDEDYYVFNADRGVVADDYQLVVDVWLKLVDIVTAYFPLIMVLTAPLLALSLAFINMRRKSPLINHFIFSLHYTAYIELLIILIYVLYLSFDPPMELLQWIIRIGASIYLVVAYRRVYEHNSWIKPILKAMWTYVIYLVNCIIVLITILFIACAIVIG